MGEQPADVGPAGVEPVRGAAFLELSSPVRPFGRVDQSNLRFCANPPALALAPSPSGFPGGRGTSLACPLTGFLQGEEGSDDSPGPPGPTGGSPTPPWEGSEDFLAFSPPDLFVAASEVLALLTAEAEVRVCITGLWSAVMDVMRDNFLSGYPQVQGYAAAKLLAALAGKVRLAVAGKFPIIPKGYSGLVEQLQAG